jgi:hypothetical protein
MGPDSERLVGDIHFTLNLAAEIVYSNRQHTVSNATAIAMCERHLAAIPIEAGRLPHGCSLPAQTEHISDSRAVVSVPGRTPGAEVFGHRRSIAE